MATLAQVHALVRGWMAEKAVSPEVFTDTFLLIFSPEVYREIQRRLVAAGVSELKDFANFDVGAGVTSVSVALSSTGFPTTVVQPIRLWERAQASSAFADFVQMEEADPDLIPRAQSTVLSHWEWKNKALNFIGSSGARTVRMQFYKYLTDLTAVSDPLAIEDSIGAMAMGTGAAAARSRGSELAADLEALFDAEVGRLVSRDPGRVWTLGGK